MITIKICNFVETIRIFVRAATPVVGCSWICLMSWKNCYFSYIFPISLGIVLANMHEFHDAVVKMQVSRKLPLQGENSEI